MWKKSQHIRVKYDSTTVIAYADNMGGIVSNSRNHWAREKWEICIASEVWLTAVSAVKWRLLDNVVEIDA